MRKKAALVAMVAVLFAEAVLSSAPALARRFIFRGQSAASRQGDAGDFVRRETVARDGVTVRSLEMPAPAGGRTVVYFHNNRETADAREGLGRAIRARGFGVLLVEYRGYGASGGGAPTEDGLYLDAEASLDMLARGGVGPERVILWGTSLGSGVAAEMARRGRAGCLVLEAPYTSIPDLVTDRVPFVPANALIDDRFETLSKAGDIHVPTLVIHGDADEIVPFAMGERVAGAIPRARLLRVRAGHHGDLLGRDGEHILAEVAALPPG